MEGREKGHHKHSSCTSPVKLHTQLKSWLAELRDYRLKVEIFKLGAKIAPLKQAAVNASPQTRRPEKYRVYRSHTLTLLCFWCERTLSIPLLK